MSHSTEPEKQDFQEVERTNGPLPANATDKQQTERYRLAQAARLIRERASEHRTDHDAETETIG
jgi:hypothetical protein